MHKASQSLDDIKITGEVGDICEDEKVDKSETPTSVRDALILEEIEDKKADRLQRKNFADRAYKVAKWGLYGWGCVLLISVIGNILGEKTFSDHVLIAITTATTLNLFAAFLGVIRGLFPGQKK